MMTEVPVRAVSAKRGIPLLEDEPRDLAEMFLMAAEKYRLPNALNYKSGDVWHAISSDEMVRRAENIALGLHSLGLNKGERVAILAGNCPEWTLTDAGCQFAGLVDVPIYTTASPRSVQYILDDSAARVLFLQDKAAYDRISTAIGGCDEVEKFVFFDAVGVELECSMSIAELEAAGATLRTAEPELALRLRSEIDPEDVATLIYTSGTTG